MTLAVAKKDWLFCDWDGCQLIRKFPLCIFLIPKCALQWPIDHYLYTKNYKYSNVKIEKLKKFSRKKIWRSLKIGLSKKIGLQLSFKNRDTSQMDGNSRGKGRALRKPSIQLIWAFALVLQQKLVSRPVDVHQKISIVLWTRSGQVIKNLFKILRLVFWVDFQKSPLFMWYPPDSYLIGGNFSDPKMGCCALTNQSCHISFGDRPVDQTWLVVDSNVGSIVKVI